MLGDPTDDQQVATMQQPASGTSKDVETPEIEAERAAVKLWQDRIKKAKVKFEADFERMRQNEDFVASIQWPGQKKIRHSRYIVNLTLRAVNQGVAMLYARNPQIVARPRKKLRYQIWDGKMETIQQVAAESQMAAMLGLPVPPDNLALLNDFQRGRNEEKLVEKVGLTLQYVYQYQTDTLQPSFKLQMKQLVRRVRTCGVGYIKVEFRRETDQSYDELVQSETRISIKDRLKIAQYTLNRLAEGKIQENDAEVDALKNLIMSFGATPLDIENTSMKERLVFDFPPATTIIPDPACRMLKGFVGAHWLVEEMHYPLDFVNAIFDVDLKPEGDLKLYSEDNKVDDARLVSGEKQDRSKKKVRLWQVQNLDDKSIFIVADGHKDYICKPEPIDPCTKGFWNIFPVTFNDIEVEEGCKATIFPPSDVDLLMPIQKERNEVRHRLNRHRRANGPKYVYPEGVIVQEDLDKIEEMEDQQYIGLKSLNPGQEPGKVLQALQVVPVQRELYETEGLQEDALLASGQQEANLGPAQPNVTATVGTIAEQSRMSVAASDVDGLDDALTEVAQAGGELLLREMSSETVRQIAGIGAAWPDDPKMKELFVSEVELEVVAASSGRPNKAIEVANWERIAPILMQSGANPQAVIRETIKRADDRLEPAEFFPIALPPPPAPPGGQQAPARSQNRRPNPQQGRQGPRQPLQSNPSGVSVPLAGA